MEFKKLLKVLPIMAMLGLLGVGAFISPVLAVTSSPTTGPVGSAVTFSTSPATLTSANYTVQFIGTDQGSTVNATVIGSTPVPVNGIVTGSFLVPNVPKGNYQIVVQGDGTPAPAPLVVGTFAVTPSITVSPISAMAGTPITVTGYGFGANLAVNIFLGSTLTTTGTPVMTVTAAQNTNGSFSVPFTLAQMPYLTTPYVVTAIDTAGNYNYALVSVLPRIISFSAEVGAVGDTITINADGFTALGSVSIFFDSLTSTPLVTVAANSSGVIPATNITIPAATRGSHAIYVRDNTYTTVFVYKSFLINQSKIILSPGSGPVGTPVTVTGNGFGDSVVVGFEFDGTAIANTTVTADNKGSFSKIITITNSPSGVHVITARVTTDSAMFAQANFTVSSNITVSPASGKTGDSVTITGTGFYPNGQITLAYDSFPLPTAPATLTVLANGTFSGIFTVPGAVEGSHTIIAADGLGNVATTGFSSTITASLTPDTSATPGFVGQDITVTGSGFKPNATITVKLEGSSIATSTSNTSGSFTITFKAPVIVKGSHPISVSDGQTTKTTDQNGVPLTFTMEGTAPQGPTLTDPASGIKAKQPITFTWGAVTDQSNPVTYKLEVATDANFTTLILSKDGLTTTSYTMTDAEKLPTVSKKAPYYWRVIATDAAGNVGTPSTANSFVVGFSWADVPVWAWVTIGFFAVIIIGGGLYLLLRRRSAY